MNVNEFLGLVLGEGAGYATIVTKDSKGVPTVQKFFSYPDELDEMVAYAERFKNEDVYFSPIVYYEQRRIRENAKSVSVVYSDADTCNPANFRIEPSISVETSKDRWHCYCCLMARPTHKELLTLPRRLLTHTATKAVTYLAGIRPSCFE